jgi:hypothetical protein
MLPVHKHLKFSTVVGTISGRSTISILPAATPPIAISKKTTGEPAGTSLFDILKNAKVELAPVENVMNN